MEHLELSSNRGTPDHSVQRGSPAIASADHLCSTWNNKCLIHTRDRSSCAPNGQAAWDTPMFYVKQLDMPDWGWPAGTGQGL